MSPGNLLYSDLTILFLPLDHSLPKSIVIIIIVILFHQFLVLVKSLFQFELRHVFIMDNSIVSIVGVVFGCFELSKLFVGDKYLVIA